ncbi:hypothetical protein [Phenylobacterium sp.]|uniref:terminase small subunit-like protein n=1 Tax=Phenylobacterium sp. TaxID=1871053 RepID=UPI0039832860
MDDINDPALAPARAGAVRFSAALGRAICARLASGESQVSICADPAMPVRGSLFRWVRDLPGFARDVGRARAAGGRVAANGRPPTFCAATAAEIFDRLCEGEGIARICRDPAMPAFSTVYYWRRHFPEFAEQVKVAREIQAERFCDLAWEIAEGVTPQTASATRVKLEQLRWQAAKLAPRQYGALKAVEPQGEAAASEPRRVIFEVRRFETVKRPDGSVYVREIEKHYLDGSIKPATGDPRVDPGGLSETW